METKINLIHNSFYSKQNLIFVQLRKLLNLTANRPLEWDNPEKKQVKSTPSYPMLVTFLPDYGQLMLVVSPMMIT